MSKWLGRGIYTVPEAARMVRIPSARLRRWFRGYKFAHAGSPREMPVVIRGELPIIGGSLALSFLDLQEARCVQEFRARRVGWPALRRAHAKACTLLGTGHPFSTGQFVSAGREIMWESARREKDPILLELSKDQFSFDRVLKGYLQPLKFAENHPVLWYPLDDSERVVIDPKRSFGAPIVTPRGVPTAILARAVRAEESVSLVAEWYAVDIPCVEDAVRYEQLLAA